MPRILIVDDDQRSRRTLCLALGSHGYKVDEVEDGMGALEAVATSPPDIVVLDRQMPGTDGIQTCLH